MPDQASPLSQQGWRRLSSGDLDGAVEVLSRAVVANDKDADAKALLGMAFSQKGLHAQAVRALHSAVTSMPENSHLRCTLGVVLERAGDLSAAAAAYHQALQIDPQHELSRRRLQAIDPLGSEPEAVSPSQPPFPSLAVENVAATEVTGATPDTPAQSLKPGHLLCARCGEETREGLSCEWCSSPLLPPAAEAPPPVTESDGTPSPPYQVPAIAVASLYAQDARARESVGVLRGVIGFAVLALGLGYFFFSDSMHFGSNAPISTVSHPIATTNDLGTLLNGGTASFRSNSNNSLIISAKDKAGSSLLITFPTQAAAPSELGGQTLISSAGPGNASDPVHSQNVLTIGGHNYYGANITAQVTVATDQQITMMLAGAFQEIDELSGLMKANIPLADTVTLPVTKD